MIEALGVGKVRPPDGQCRECGRPVLPIFLPRSQSWAPPSTMCAGCIDAARESAERTEAQEAIRLAGISDRLYGMTWEQALYGDGMTDGEVERAAHGQRVGVHAGNRDAVECLRDWTAGSVYLHGPPGSGKTFLAQMVAVTLLSVPMRWVELHAQDEIRPGHSAVVQRIGGASVCVTSEADLLSRIRRRKQGLADVEGEPHPLDAPKRAGLLVLDDIGSRTDGKGSAWGVTPADLLEEIVDHRYRSRGLPIIATSNHTLRDLGRLVSQRVASRLEEMCGRRVFAVRGSWRCTDAAI